MTVSTIHLLAPCASAFRWSSSVASPDSIKYADTALTGFGRGPPALTGVQRVFGHESGIGSLFALHRRFWGPPGMGQGGQGQQNAGREKEWHMSVSRRGGP